MTDAIGGVDVAAAHATTYGGTRVRRGHQPPRRRGRAGLRPAAQEPAERRPGPGPQPAAVPAGDVRPGGQPRDGHRPRPARGAARRRARARRGGRGRPARRTCAHGRGARRHAVVRGRRRGRPRSAGSAARAASRWCTWTASAARRCGRRCATARPPGWRGCWTEGSRGQASRAAATIGSNRTVRWFASDRSQVRRGTAALREADRLVRQERRLGVVGPARGRDEVHRDVGPGERRQRRGPGEGVDGVGHQPPRREPRTAVGRERVLHPLEHGRSEVGTPRERLALDLVEVRLRARPAPVDQAHLHGEQGAHDRTAQPHRPGRGDTAVDEHDPAHPLTEIGGHERREERAHRVADQHDVVEPELLDELAHGRDVPGESGAGDGVDRAAAAGQVRRHQPHVGPRRRQAVEVLGRAGQPGQRQHGEVGVVRPPLGAGEAGDPAAAGRGCEIGHRANLAARRPAARRRWPEAAAGGPGTANGTTPEPDPVRCVREGGFEPPRPFGHWHLKPARLPFRHSRQ